MTPPSSSPAGAGQAPAPDHAPEQERVVVRDKRRLDPTSGALRDPGPEGPAPTEHASASPAEPAAAGDPAGLEATLAERTADLQRLKAEFDNYRKRVERDRLAMVEQATATLLTALLPVLDDVDRARQHGDLTGAFAAVGEQLERVLTGLGLERYGAPGEPFDPAVHEALMQEAPLASVAVPTATTVLQPGYRLAGSGRVLRPARVAVADPLEEPPADEASVAGSGTAEGTGD